MIDFHVPILKISYPDSTRPPGSSRDDTKAIDILLVPINRSLQEMSFQDILQVWYMISLLIRLLFSVIWNIGRFTSLRPKIHKPYSPPDPVE